MLGRGLPLALKTSAFEDYLLTGHLLSMGFAGSAGRFEKQRFRRRPERQLPLKVLHRQPVEFELPEHHRGGSRGAARLHEPFPKLGSGHRPPGCWICEHRLPE